MPLATGSTRGLRVVFTFTVFMMFIEFITFWFAWPTVVSARSVRADLAARRLFRRPSAAPDRASARWVDTAWCSEKPDKLRLPRCGVTDEEFVTGLHIRLKKLV
jgi:hypothetical protein